MRLRTKFRVATRLLLCGFFVFACVQPARAHVGSKDVFEELNAGGYKLFVTVRMPTAIPGVAAVEVRATGDAIDQIHIIPLPVTGEASLHPPTPDVMVRSKDDPDYYTGNLWMMAAGSWQVRFEISGADGDRTVSVPVPAIATTVKKMNRALGALLALLGIILVVSMAAIIAAAVREADLKPGLIAGPDRKRQGRIAGTATLVMMSLIVWSGMHWWNIDAMAYASDLYQPLNVQPVLQGNVLDLMVSGFVPKNRYNYMLTRMNSDFLPDHNHLMHLYMIREPEMDAVFHVHPDLVAQGDFRMHLPNMPAGEYKLYGDVVHANGFPETLLATINVPAGMVGSVPGPDDAAAFPAPLSAGMLGSSYPLPDGYTMVWTRPPVLTAGTAYIFHFALLDTKGKAAGDVVPYMGMAGHAAFVKTDGTVFAHTHPEGSASMAAMMLANSSNGAGNDTSGDAMAGMNMNMPMGMAMPGENIPNTVEFPYGFPAPGRYRIFIQMKHGGTIETGTFDAIVN
ncbi:MAG TPA: hypothetical protein VNU94_06720 [Acidobacteriaceae bacterium]|nr:hypothetical protein [Acidobacteriaceae bacterium]